MVWSGRFIKTYIHIWVCMYVCVRTVRLYGNIEKEAERDRPTKDEASALK